MPRNINPQVAHHRAEVAGLTRAGAGAQRITEARARFDEAKIRADVAKWPPLSPAARAEIAVLVLQGGDTDGA